MTNKEPIPKLLDLLDQEGTLFTRLPANYAFFTARDIRKPSEFNTAKRALSTPPPGDEQIFCEFFYKRISKCY